MMMRYLMHASRFSFLLCLLAALSTSCNINQHKLGFGLKSSAGKQNLLRTLHHGLADHGGSDQAHRDYDPYDQNTFRQEMTLIIERKRAAKKAIYKYGAQECSMLTVAAHYDLSGELVKYLLKKKVHKRMEVDEITRCFVAATGNHTEEDIKRDVLRRLVKVFKKSSDYFKRGPGSLDDLLLQCNPSGLPVLMQTLYEQDINIYAVDEQGHTLLERMNNNYGRFCGPVKFYEILKELLKLDEFNDSLPAPNRTSALPPWIQELLNSSDVIESRL